MHTNHAGMPACAVTGRAGLPLLARHHAGQHTRTALAVIDAYTRLINGAKGKRECGTMGAHRRRELALRMQHRAMREEILRISRWLCSNGLHEVLLMIAARDALSRRLKLRQRGAVAQIGLAGLAGLAGSGRKKSRYVQVALLPAAQPSIFVRLK